MKLMALVMISRIGSEVLIGLANRPDVGDQFQTALAIAGIAVVVFVIAMYVPNIIQGVVQGASVAGGMEAIRHGAQAGAFAAGGAFLGASAASKGTAAASDARASGSSIAGAALRGMGSGIGHAGWAVGSAAREKSMSSPGAYTGSLLGLANAKLDQTRHSGRPTPPPPPVEDKN
jgi:type IV secretion system protein TrbL